eukprot:2227790-Alexandrium_andersonii.AAC.1
MALGAAAPPLATLYRPSAQQDPGSRSSCRRQETRAGCLWEAARRAKRSGRAPTRLSAASA